MQPASTYDELIKGYYGGRRHRHRHRHHGATAMAAIADTGSKSAERLLARYGYEGHVHASGKPRLGLSFSVDDGGMVIEPAGPARFEEYVVAASLGEGRFDEYVVDPAALAGQASLSGPASDPATDPQADTWWTLPIRWPSHG